MRPRFFRSPADFRDWLERHHASATEIWVGFYKVASARRGIVYREALDAALCYGWIDGLVRRIDEERYAQRFTPRRKGSTWSLVNTRRVKELDEQGLLQPAGRAAFERRDEQKTALYSFEQRRAALPPEYEARLRSEPAAAAFFAAQPPGYRRLAAWWVVSARKPETRERRLAILIEDSRAGRRVTAPRPGRDA